MTPRLSSRARAADFVTDCCGTRRGNPDADQPTRLANLAGPRMAPVPAETLGSNPEALDQLALRKGPARRRGADLRLVSQPEDHGREVGWDHRAPHCGCRGYLGLLAEAHTRKAVLRSAVCCNPVQAGAFAINRLRRKDSPLGARGIRTRGAPSQGRRHLFADEKGRRSIGMAVNGGVYFMGDLRFGSRLGRRRVPFWRELRFHAGHTLLR